MLYKLYKNKEVITLGELREFLTNTCKELSDDTPIQINAVSIEDKPVTSCIEILADTDSVEFYNF